jgi:hypothetical protein
VLAPAGADGRRITNTFARRRKLPHPLGTFLGARRSVLVAKLAEVAGVKLVKSGDVLCGSLARETFERSKRLPGGSSRCCPGARFWFRKPDIRRRLDHARSGEDPTARSLRIT